MQGSNKTSLLVILAVIMAGGVGFVLYFSPVAADPRFKATHGQDVVLFDTMEATRCPAAPDHPIFSVNYNKKEGENRWIVLTTIFKPTDCIKFLATIPGWNMVVVGDKKTPSPWSPDWTVPAHVHYLSPEDQEKLSYKIVPLLPWANYARKNIGFLYAVQKGATVIYETDDDNCPTVPNLVILPERMPVPEVQTTYQTENAYAHFCQPTVWQRGIPVDDIKREDPHTVSNDGKERFVPIQQALADNDPDVDAMFRLTRKLPIYFDRSKGPVAMPPGTLSPTNSQNTVAYRDAFWGTLLPFTVSARVTDIWRGYWSQRMLWDFDAQLAFLPPTVSQFRTPQSYLANMKAESQLYEQATALIRFLRHWGSCKPTMDERLVDLAEAMAKNGYWAQGDVDLMKAWIHDLKEVGYKFPKPTNCRFGQSEEDKKIAGEKAFVRPSWFTFLYSDYRGF